jgi:tetratricopeptide (TPR) repeat protein
MRRRKAASLLVFSAWLVLTAGLAACSSEEERFRSHLERAEAYRQEDKNREALIELRNALKLRPKDAETNYRIGLLLQEEKQFQDAVFSFREAYRLDPARVDAAMAEVKIVLFDDPERAEELIRDARSKFPNDAQVHRRESEIALVKSDTERALTSALTAVNLKPDDFNNYVQLGIVHEARIREAALTQKQIDLEIYEAAEDAFQKADKLANGTSPVAMIELGKLYSVWPERSAEAGAAYRRAVEAAKKQNPKAVNMIGGAAGVALGHAVQVGDQELRKWALSEIVAVDPARVEAWHQLALIADGEGRSGEDVWKELLAQRPDDAAAHIRHAMYLVDREQADEAFAALAAFEQRKVDVDRVLGAKLQLETRLGRNEAAQATLERLQREHPESLITQLASARDLLGRGRVEEAATLLRSLTGSHEDAEAYRLLSIAELRLGKLEAATSAIDHHLTLIGGTSGAPVESLRSKLQVVYAARDWNGTVEMVRALAQGGRAPTVGDRLMLAQAFYELGRAAPARGVLEKLLEVPEPPLGAVIEYARREGEANPERAYQLLSAAHARYPAHPLVLHGLTAADLKAGRANLALERLNKTLESGQVDPSTLMLRARVLAQAKQLEAAERDALRAFEVSPNLPGALDLLLSIYALQNRLDEALASFADAEKAGALGPGPRALLGRLYLLRGDDERAIEVLSKALGERSDLPAAKNDLSFALARKGQDLDRALTLAQEAQQAMDQNPHVADTLGYVYLRKGLNDAALEQFKFALGLSGEDKSLRSVVQYHQGLALRALGRHEEAVAALEAALAQGADFPDSDDAKKELEAARSAAGAKTAGSS